MLTSSAPLSHLIFKFLGETGGDSWVSKAPTNDTAIGIVPTMTALRFETAHENHTWHPASSRDRRAARRCQRSAGNRARQPSRFVCLCSGPYFDFSETKRPSRSLAFRGPFSPLWPPLSCFQRRRASALPALAGVAFVAVHAGMYPAERKVSADLMDITEIQMRADKNMPMTVIKDHM